MGKEKVALVEKELLISFNLRQVDELNESIGKARAFAAVLTHVDDIASLDSETLHFLMWEVINNLSRVRVMINPKTQEA